MTYREKLMNRINAINNELEKTKQNIAILQGHLAEATFQLSEFDKYEKEREGIKEEAPVPEIKEGEENGKTDGEAA